MQPANLLVVVVLSIFILVMMAGTRDAPSMTDSHGDVAMLMQRRLDERVPGLQTSTTSEPEAATATPSAFEVQIRRPSGPPMVRLASSDPLGRVAEVACSTCHSSRPANFDNRESSSLDEFHQGLKVNHGKLACYACHHPVDADSLRSADGTSIPYPEVMTLCSQCHAPQAASFARDAHGGMNGFWDLSRGPQTKNNCVDCHDPHAPQFPKMIVDFKPIDRFLDTEATHDDHE